MLINNKYHLSLKKPRCITASVLRAKVDAQCDKLATELSWQCLWRSTFDVFKSPILIYSTCIWRLRWGWPHLSCRHLRQQKTTVPGLSCGCYLRNPTISRFSRTPTCDRQTDRHTTMAYTAW